MEKGYYTIALAYPIIPVGTARLRIIVTAIHTKEQIDGLVQAFKEVGDSMDFFTHVTQKDHPKQYIPVSSSAISEEPIAFKSKL